jgi:dTDP-4-dehydrorhamnose reductase
MGDEALAVHEIVPIASSEYPTAAARPLDARLDCRRVCERYALHLPDWQEGLKLVLDELATDALSRRARQGL